MPIYSQKLNLVKHLKFPSFWHQNSSELFQQYIINSSSLELICFLRLFQFSFRTINKSRQIQRSYKILIQKYQSLRSNLIRIFDPSLIKLMKEENQILRQSSNRLQEQIEDLKLFEIPDCPICLIELFQDQEVLECGHVFHNRCIKGQSKCPICKSDIKKIVKLFYHMTEKQSYVFKLKQKIQIRDQKICELQKSKENLQKEVKTFNQEISQKNKLLEQAQNKNNELCRTILSSQIKNLAKKMSLDKKIDQLQKQSSQYKKEKQDLVKQVRKYERSLELKKLIQQPNELIQQMKEIFQETNYFQEKIINECSQLLILQSKEITTQKQNNTNLKERIKKQQNQINQLKRKIIDMKENQKKMIGKYQKLEIAFKKLQRNCQFFRSRWELAFGQDQYYDLQDYFVEEQKSFKQKQKDNKKLSVEKKKTTLNPQLSTTKKTKSFKQLSMKNFQL